MPRSVTHGHSVTEQQAIEELTQLGYHPVVAEVPPADNQFHRHEFDTIFYVLEGELELTVRDTGEVTVLKAGDRIQTTGDIVHRERHNGYKAVFGFSVDPATLTFPLEKEP